MDSRCERSPARGSRHCQACRRPDPKHGRLNNKEKPARGLLIIKSAVVLAKYLATAVNKTADQTITPWKKIQKKVIQKKNKKTKTTWVRQSGTVPTDAETTKAL